MSRAERAQVKKGLCVWQTEYGMPGESYCQEKPARGHFYCAEHIQDQKDLYPGRPLLYEEP
jgi:hypothetical protein